MKKLLLLLPLLTMFALSGSAQTVSRQAALTTAVVVKPAAANLYGWHIYNPNASACSIDVFNTTAVTLGTTAPVMSIMVPATSESDLAIPPVNFNTAISVAAVTAAGGGTTCSTGVVVNLFVSQ